MTRNEIYDAIFDRLKTIPGLRTTGQRVKLWTEVAKNDQPALFMTSGGTETYTQVRGAGNSVNADCTLYFYSSDGDDPSAVPMDALNDFMDALDAMLKPNPVTGVCDFGMQNEVSHIWIEGDVLKDPGDLDGQALAVIPLKVLLKNRT